MSIEDFNTLDSSTYDAFVGNANGIIIFFKKLCPHCKVMATVLEKMKAQMSDIDLAAIDSEEYPDIMDKAGVARVPTLCVVKGGELRAKMNGIKNVRETIAFYNQS